MELCTQNQEVFYGLSDNGEYKPVGKIPMDTKTCTIADIDDYGELQVPELCLQGEIKSMKPENLLYKEMIWYMLDQQFSQKEIYTKLECSQAAVSRAKKEWDKMGITHQKQLLKEIKEKLGDDAKLYENPNRKTSDQEEKPEVEQAGFRTPYSAMRNGKSVITRY